MAGSLIKIDEEIVTSAVASVTLTGIDSTYDVYMLKVNNLKVSTDNTTLYGRVSNSGTADTTSNYDRAAKELRSDTTFTNVANTNLAYFTLLPNLENETGDSSANANGIFYLFNWYNASEYSFITQEMVAEKYTGNILSGLQGGGVHTVASQYNEVFMYMSGGNINSGSFTLYGLKK